MAEAAGPESVWVTNKDSVTIWVRVQAQQSNIDSEQTETFRRHVEEFTRATKESGNASVGLTIPGVGGGNIGAGGGTEESTTERTEDEERKFRAVEKSWSAFIQDGYQEIAPGAELRFSPGGEVPYHSVMNGQAQQPRINWRINGTHFVYEDGEYNEKPPDPVDNGVLDSKGRPVADATGAPVVALEGTQYRIQNPLSEMVLNVQDAGGDKGESKPVTAKKNDGGYPTHRAFYFVPGEKEGFYKIKNELSGKVVNVKDADGGGEEMTANPDDGGFATHREFELLTHEVGLYFLRNRASGKVLNVKHAHEGGDTKDVTAQNQDGPEFETHRLFRFLPGARD